MIPKIIHYCWFGHNPKSELILRCIESWKKFCPDYEIKEWNEDNYDFSRCQYAADAYKEKKWGFVPDFIRLKLIYEFGGIYLDTDVELIKNLDPLLNKPALVAFENNNSVNTGSVIMAEPGNTIIKAMYELYDTINFYHKDGSFNLTASPYYNTQVLSHFGLKPNNTEQILTEGKSEIFVYPAEYFCPKNFVTQELNITANTYSIHWYDASCFDDVMKTVWDYRRKVSQKIKNRKVIDFLVHLYSLKQRFKFYGPKETIKYYMKLLKRRIQQ